MNIASYAKKIILIDNEIQAAYETLYSMFLVKQIPTALKPIRITVFNENNYLIFVNALISLSKKVNLLITIFANNNFLNARNETIKKVDFNNISWTSPSDLFLGYYSLLETIEKRITDINDSLAIYGSIPSSDVPTTYDSVWSQADLYDEISGSYYNSIYVPNRDEKGNLIEIKHGLPFDLRSYNREKERPSDFFKRHSQATVISSGSPARAGVSVIDGQIISNTPVKNERPLAYMQDGTLKAFSDTDSALDIIAKGGINVWGTFYPIVENGQAVPPNTNIISWNSLKNKNPRALIVQLKNGDKQIISIHGRFKRSSGMTWEEMINFALSIPNIDLAYNLDGGGSTHAILNGQYLTPMYDEKRTVEREVADFIYVERSSPISTGDNGDLLQSLKNQTDRMTEKFDS